MFKPLKEQHKNKQNKVTGAIGVGRNLLVKTDKRELDRQLHSEITYQPSKEVNVQITWDESTRLFAKGEQTEKLSLKEDSELSVDTKLAQLEQKMLQRINLLGRQERQTQEKLSSLDKILFQLKRGDLWTRKQAQQMELRIETTLASKTDRQEIEKVIRLANALIAQFEQIKQRCTAVECDQHRLSKRTSALEDSSVHKSIFEKETKRINTELAQTLILIEQNKRSTEAQLNEVSGQQLWMCHKGEHNKRIVHDLLAKEENNNIAMSNLLARLQKLEGLNILGVTLKENSEECLAFVKELKQEYEGLKMKIASAQEVCEMKRMREIERMNAVINEKIIEVRSDFVCRVEQCLEERIKRFKAEELPCQMQQGLEDFTAFRVKILERINFLEKKIIRTEEEFAKKNQQCLCRVQRQLTELAKTEEVKSLKAQLITATDTKELVKQSEKKTMQALLEHTNEQKMINATLCSQNVVARWLWTSGELRNNLVVWNKEIINTLPQNFKIIANENSVIVTSNGIYRIEMGFYARKKPVVQIVIDGKTVVSAVNNNSYVLHHSSGKLKDVDQSDITGLTYIDFLSLRQNSRIAISFVGDSPKEGFLGLQRL